MISRITSKKRWYIRLKALGGVEDCHIVRSMSCAPLHPETDRQFEEAVAVEDRDFHAGLISEETAFVSECARGFCDAVDIQVATT